ncbi:MAG: hypothetical protein HKN91_10855 [Acidimicrobiia bacterium]|nr:hypothetical protein [Acidimicrobiia bacterium]
MSHRRIRTGTGLALCVVLLTGAVVAADTGPPVEVLAIPAVDSGNQVAGDLAESTNCRETFEKNTGIAAFNWCYSDDGNIVMIEHSAGLEHVGNGTITEGWCVSANHVQRGVTYGSQANTNLETPTYPGINKVVHKTVDGDLQIEQKFRENYRNRRITVTMKVKNLSDEPLTNVYLARFIDADLSNTTGGDVWTSNSRSVSVSEPGSSQLDLVPRTTKYNANSLIYSSFLPDLDQDCYSAAADTTLEASASDRSMGVFYQLGTIFPGESKAVIFDYYIDI